MNDHPRHAEIEAARLLLEKLGVTPADLLDAPAGSPVVPTFAGYIPRVSAAVSPGTRRVYGSYWNRVIQAWGPRPITTVTALDISQLAEQIKAGVVKRKNARGGRGAAEHLIAAPALPVQACHRRRHPDREGESGSAGAQAAPAQQAARCPPAAVRKAALAITSSDRRRPAWLTVQCRSPITGDRYLCR
jgi:hypothetical protein